MGAVPEQKQEIQMQEARIFPFFVMGVFPVLPAFFCFFAYYSILFYAWQDFFQLGKNFTLIGTAVPIRVNHYNYPLVNAFSISGILLDSASIKYSGSWICSR